MMVNSMTLMSFPFIVAVHRALEDRTIDDLQDVRASIGKQALYSRDHL